MRRLLSVLLATAFVASDFTLAAHAAPASFFGSLHYRLIGPFRGGRALAVTGVPGDPNHFYFGAVDGGVWESTNAGRTWAPIFDSQDIGSIGAIAVAPSDPRTIYVGSGEADMRSDIAYGDGMYKSTDGGRTWAHLGLDDTRQIGSIVVDPRDANVLYVAALGHQYGPNAQRGVYKSTDGGTHWVRALYLNEDTGAIDLAMSPADPQTILAAMWQTRRPPWNVYPPSSGPASGLYVTHDGGATWAHVTRGLPARVGRIGVSFSPANPQRVYAVVDSDVAHGGIYRSDDGGASWRRTNEQVRLWQRGWYFGGITADTQSADTVYVMDTSTYRSSDGGVTFAAIKGDPTGDDFHSLWIDPSDARRMILGSDQGVAVSVDRAATWSSWYNQPTAQLYHVATDDRFPYWVYAAQQDSGSVAMPSTGRYATMTAIDGHWIDAGGENGYIIANPPHSVYGSAANFAGGPVTLENIDTGWERDLDPTLAYPNAIWRSTWTVPIAMAIDRRTLYFGSQRVFRSRDGGSSWQIVSPDLTRAYTPPLPNLDAPTRADDNGLRRHGVVYAIAPSPRDANVVWVGTDDGLVWLSRDAGAHWTNVTPPALTAWSKVGIIEASHFSTSAAYAAIDRHRLDDYHPYIYRTRDAGRTWQSIAIGIPDGSFVNVVREDPFVRGLLFAGTEKGVEVSFDDGDRWQSLQLNLPVTSVRDLDVHGEDLVVATHGRGIYVLDDISPLRQMAAAEASNDGAFLFAPAAAYRVHAVQYNEGTPYPPDEPQSDDAPIGVNVDYILRDAGTVTLTISDASGVLRRWSSATPATPPDSTTLDYPPQWAHVPAVPSGDAGTHRFLWNFAVGTEDGPLAPPGRYVVRLAHDGKTYERTVTILRDPRVTATDGDLRAQYALAESIEARLSDIAAARRRTHDPRLLGVAPPRNPDDSVGAPSHDFTSLRALRRDFNNLEQAVESADAAPTPDMRRAYAALTATLDATLTRIGRY